MSGTYDVPYLLTARAVADRPAFDKGVACGKDHAVEVFKMVRLHDLEPRLADYATLLRISHPLRRGLPQGRAGMHDRLAGEGSGQDGLAGAVMAPVLPSGASIGWAPAAPDDWARGRRGLLACTS